MASQVTLKALGLNYSPNNLALPEGSLVIADDVIIRRDNVVECRRGYRDYCDKFSNFPNQFSKQLISYKDRILNHFSSTLQYDTGVVDSNGKAVFANFAGNYYETEDGLRIKSIEANKNLYFTTNEGIKKIAARTAADFTTASGFIRDAGAVKATDFTASLEVTQGQSSGFLPSDAAVGYRIVWGYKDLNDNLILGAPSNSLPVYNYLNNLVPLDLNNFLLLLDDLVQNGVTYNSVFHNTATYNTESFPLASTFSGTFGVNVTDDVETIASNLLDAANYMDKFSIIADTNLSQNNKPLQINTDTVYTFTLSAGLASNVTAGTIYTNGGNNFIVKTAAAGGSTTLVCTGAVNATPTTSGTLTYSSGTGPSPLTYNYYVISGTGFSANNGIASIEFKEDPSTVFTAGDLIEVYGAVDRKGYEYSFNTNKKYTFTINPSAYITSGTTLTSNGQTFLAKANSTFIFTIGTGNTANINDTYTYNGVTFTIASTVTTNSTTFTATATSAPAIPNPTPFTLTRVTGTGSATITFTALAAQLVTTGTGVPSPDGVTTGTLVAGASNYTFSSYVKSDPAASAGAVYTNNSQAFIVTSFSDLTKLVTSGTANPLSSGTLTKVSGTGDTTIDFASYAINDLSYTKFNNTSIGETPNPYWTITEVDATNKLIKFNLTETLTIPAGTPGTATKIVSYDYRNIVRTGDDTYATSLNDLTTTIPPNNEQLNVIQHTIYRLSNRLKAEKSRYISTAMKTTYVDNYNITTYANVRLKIDVPSSAVNNSEYFFQVYRTRNFLATPFDTLGVTVIPDQEMRLVYEAFPTDADILAGFITYLDSYPEDLRNQNVNLYTNPTTGDGVSQANDVPPIAKDINRFKNVVFYSNTKTRQRLNPLQLVGTSNISTGDSLTISDGTTNGTKTYIFQEGVAQVTRIVFGSPTPASLAGKYFNIYSAEDQKAYYVWYRVDNTTGTDPNITGKTGIRVDLFTGDTVGQIRDKTKYTLNSAALDFIATDYTASGMEVTNINSGITTDATDGNIGANITITTPVDGKGEDPNEYYTFACSSLTSNASAGATYEDAYNNIFTVYAFTAIGSTSIVFLGNGNPPASGNLTRTSGIGTGPSVIAFTSYSVVPPKVLLLKPSTSVTAAQAIDATANSLVKIINKQEYSSINAYYISGATNLPGIMNFESKVITGNQFYVQAGNTAVGTSFTPNIEPYNTDNNTITRLSGTQVQFQTTSAHNLINGDQILISYARVSNGGLYQYLNGIFAVEGVTSTTFTINVVTATFTNAVYNFSWSKIADAISSSNEEKANRVYYSKLSQPEAVPLLNYFDIGSSDKQILRIFPLRDSLFVFKEDGLYRISGESAPFVVTLFDSSCVLIAPDTVSVANNIIYGWTSKGISNVTESGVLEVSRPIDTVILKLASVEFINFPHASWGIGYDSDNSYTVFTCASVDDEIATVGFRFSNLTNTWTNIKRAQTCGVLNLKDDKLYMGSGSSQIIDQERKSFNRTDHADRDFKLYVNPNSYVGKTITFPSVLDVEEGDVLVQTQGLTVYDYNSLLQKLDIDPNIGRFTYTISDLNTTTVNVNTFNYNTSTPYVHQLSVGDWVEIQTSNASPATTGVYQIVSLPAVPAPTSFTIQISQPLVVGTTGYTNTIQRNYENTFLAVNGDNLRNKLLDLCAYLDNDPGLLTSTYVSTISDKTGFIDAVITGNPGTIQTTTVPNGLINGRVVTIIGANNVINPSIANTYAISNVTNSTFKIPVSILTGDGPPLTTPLTYSTSGNSNNLEDLLVCYNAVISLLNNPASGTSYKNYEQITDTTFFEVVILSVDTTNKIVTINSDVQFIVGDISVYKNIPCKLQYAPLTFGDPLQLKQVYEATIMLNNRAFTNCSAAFSSDLKPEFTSIEFIGDGNGIFGFHSAPGFGYGFFGGSSNSAPLRTIIPREAQRCRYINVQVEHNVAREDWDLFGITLTFNQMPSTRAYR